MMVFRSLTLSPQLLFKGYFVRHLLQICFIGADFPSPHNRQTSLNFPSVISQTSVDVSDS